MEISRRHWILALFGAASIHAALAAAILWQPSDAGAESVDYGGLEVTLVSAGEAAGGEVPPLVAAEEADPVEAPTADPAEAPHEDVEIVENPTDAETADTPDIVDTVEPTETAEAADPVIEAETLREEVEPAEVSEIAEALSPEPVEAEAVAVEAPLQEAEVAEIVEALPLEPIAADAIEMAEAVLEEAEAVELVEALSPEPVEAVVIDSADAVKVDAPPEEAQAVEPELVKAESVMPAPPVRPKDLPKVARAEPAPQRQAAPRPRSSVPAASAASRQSVSGAGARVDASAIRRYSADLAAALRARLRYPDAARARRIEGVTTVRFTVDASGRVLSSSIVDSAGEASLDRAALAAAAVGTRLPAPPGGRGSLTVSVPLRFSIR